MLSLKQRALQSTQVVCVAYTNEFSVRGNSLIDLQIGCRHNRVSSNQDVLDRATSGSLAVVTSQCRHFVIGILGDHDNECRVWKESGGRVFKYSRVFTPITDVLPIASVLDAWRAACEIHEVVQKSKNLFHSRFCGYGTWYVPALHSAIEHGVFPVRSDGQQGTHTVFES